MAFFSEGLKIATDTPEDTTLAETSGLAIGALGFYISMTGRSEIEAVLQVMNADGVSVDETLLYIYQPAQPSYLGPYNYTFTLNQSLRLQIPGWGGENGEGSNAVGAIVTTPNF